MYTITNIEYGIGPWGSEFIYGTIGNPKPDETEYNVHSVTVIQGNGHNILVDTGIDTEDPAKRTLWDQLIDTCKGVIWALEQVDLKPEDIDTVILTHAHIDHIGGVELFKNARIYIQQDEFEAWERMVAQPEYAQATLPACMPSDYPAMRAMVNEGLITLLNGDVINFLPDIDIHVLRDCHSVAEQVVIVKNTVTFNDPDTHTIVNEQGQRINIRSSNAAPSAKKKYLIAGDIAARPANLVGMGEWKAYLAPILGRTGSMLKVFDAYQWILEQIEGDMSRLVLTHDVTMSERMKSTLTEDGLHIHYIC